MSTKIHPKRGLLMNKSVHENSPKVSTKNSPLLSKKFALYVHEKSATQICLAVGNVCELTMYLELF